MMPMIFTGFTKVPQKHAGRRCFLCMSGVPLLWSGYLPSDPDRQSEHGGRKYIQYFIRCLLYGRSVHWNIFVQQNIAETFSLFNLLYFSHCTGGNDRGPWRIHGSYRGFILCVCIVHVNCGRNGKSIPAGAV